MRRTLIFISTFCLSLLCTPAVHRAEAQEETIFDPENPTPPTDPTPNPTEENIFDPENPSQPTDPTPNPSPSPPPITTHPASLSRITLSTFFLADTDFRGGLEDVYESHTRAQFSSQTHPRPSLTLSLQGDASYIVRWEHDASHPDALPGPWDDAENPQAFSHLRMREASLHGPLGPLFWTVGLQRISWGATDITRPSDLIGPNDLTQNASPPFNSAALSATGPTFALRAQWPHEYGSLDAVLLPSIDPQRVSAFTTDSSPFRPESPLVAAFPLFGLFPRLLDPSLLEAIEPSLSSANAPDQTPNNTSLALRSTWRGSLGEASLAGLYGWDRTPTLQLDPDLAQILNRVAQDEQLLEDLDIFGFLGRNPDILPLQNSLLERAQRGDELISLHYRRWLVLALDATTYLGPIGVRAETTWTPKRTFISPNFSSLRKPSTHSALELSYEDDSGHLLCILEGFWFQIYDVEPSDLLIVQPENRGAILATRLNSLLWTQTLDLAWTTATAYLIDTNELVFSSQLDWQLHPSWTLSSGLQLIHTTRQDSLTPLALMRGNDQLFLGLLTTL